MAWRSEKHFVQNPNEIPFGSARGKEVWVDVYQPDPPPSGPSYSPPAISSSGGTGGTGGGSNLLADQAQWLGGLLFWPFEWVAENTPLWLVRLVCALSAVAGAGLAFQQAAPDDYTLFAETPVPDGLLFAAGGLVAGWFVPRLAFGLLRASAYVAAALAVLAFWGGLIWLAVVLIFDV